MPGYIDKDALIKTTEEAPFTMSMCVSVEECNGMNRARKLFVKIFKALPTADVAPVIHAKWIKKHDDMCWWWECSACGAEPLRSRWNDSDALSKFCPDCGARLEVDWGESNG